MSAAKLESSGVKDPAWIPAKHHVLVQFGEGISPDAQGIAMLAMERHLRELTDRPVEVFKDTMGDDSKLRRAMSVEQRAKL